MEPTKVKTDVNHPFDWLHEEAWMWMAEMNNNSDYIYVDDIYRVIDGIISKEEFEEMYGEKVDDFKELYKKEFPKILVSCLLNLADTIRNNEIEFEINFND